MPVQLNSMTHALTPTVTADFNRMLCHITDTLSTLQISWDNVHYSFEQRQWFGTNKKTVEIVRLLVTDELNEFSSQHQTPLEFTEFLEMFDTGAVKYKYSRRTDAGRAKFSLPLPYAGVSAMNLSQQRQAISTTFARMALELLILYVSVHNPVTVPKDGKFFWRTKSGAVCFRSWL